MWNDNDTRIDFIDFQHLISAVTTIIDNDNLLPCTIGLYGDWGSGKSSLMQMVEAHYENDKDVLSIKFNGWLFEGYENAKTVLMGTILDELIKKRTLTEKGKKLALKLLKKIDWMKLATAGVKSGLGFLALGPVGLSLGALDTKTVIDQLSKAEYEDYVKENVESKNQRGESLRMGLREFHNDFSELLKETKVEKLIVFIDDLDRCNPNTVIDTLEAIKLFLFVENSAFIIGADERLIKYAVKKRFPEITGTERFEVGRDYLEKLVQFPIRIPQLSQSEMETYINLLFTSLIVKNESDFNDIRRNALDHKFSSFFSTGFNINNLSKILDASRFDNLEEIKDSLSLSAKITPVLTTGLNGNPRQSKRFLNTLLLRIQMAESKEVRLERTVLAKLMILEYFKPELFREFSKLQVKEEGKPKIIEIIESSLKESGTSSKKTTKSKKNEKAAEFGKEAENWLVDDEIKDWFKAEPNLTGIDLRPYFYFSRDSLGAVSAVVQRMSPEAQQAYSKLIAGSQVERNKGLEKVQALNLADAAAIFEIIRSEFHEKGQTSDGRSYLDILIQLCKVRIELIPQLFMYLKTVQLKKLKLSLIPKLKALTENTQYKQLLNDCLKYFSEGENEQLAKAARLILSETES